MCVSWQIQKASLNYESELLMPVSFRGSAQCHPSVEEHSSESEQTLAASATNCQNLALDLLICWVARELVCVVLKKRRTCRPATPDSYGRHTPGDKTKQPHCVHRLLFHHSDCQPEIAPRMLITQICVVSVLMLFLHEG